MINYHSFLLQLLIKEPLREEDSIRSVLLEDILDQVETFNTTIIQEPLREEDSVRSVLLEDILEQVETSTAYLKLDVETQECKVCSNFDFMMKYPLCISQYFLGNGF